MEQILDGCSFFDDVALDDDPFCIENRSSSPARRQPYRTPLDCGQTPVSCKNSSGVKSHLERLERILTGLTPFAASCPQHFILTTHSGILALSTDRRTVQRSSIACQPRVHLSKPLESDKKLVIRVDGFPFRVFQHSFRFSLKNTFDGNVIGEFDVSTFARPGTTVTFELATGRRVVVITIDGHSVGIKVSYMYLATESAARTLYPMLTLSGNAEALTIGGSSHPARDMIRKRPNGSSLNVLAPKPKPLAKHRPDTASSAYSSLNVSPSPTKTPLPKMGDIQENEKTATQHPVVPRDENRKRKTTATVPSQPEKNQVVPMIKRKKAGRKWYSNQFMSFRDSVITRSRSGNGRNYIFGSELRVNQSFLIRIVDVDQEDGEFDVCALYLGATKTPLLQLDFSTLPVNPIDLFNQGPDSNWLLSGNLSQSVGAFDGLRFARTGTSVRMSIESGESIDVITGVDPAIRIFPFIHISGCIRSVEVRAQ